MLPSLACFAAVLSFAQAAPPADEIMRRATENQDRAREPRTSYVYDMNVFVRLKRANGKTAREETRDYVVAPGQTGAKRRLEKVAGKIFDGRQATAYADAGHRTKDSDIDGAITDSFARAILWKRGGFGPTVEWFPIASNGLSRYSFHLAEEEVYEGRPVYKIEYKQNDKEECWEGEALIDREEMQPALITSQWACKIPAAVKLMLGINVQHVGAKIVYRRFDKDLCFPVRGGGEMKLRVLFLYARTIAFSAANNGFRKADVKSSVEFEAEGQ